MDRRDFLKLCSVAGLGVVATGMPFGQRAANAAGQPRFFVNFFLDGGCDFTLLCDPKGWDTAPPNPTGVNHTYGPDDILSAGNIPYAPSVENTAFFSQLYPNLVVVNGINGKTNAHDIGQRAAAAGDMKEGFPALAAVIAGVNAAAKPMSFVGNGGYMETAGLVGAASFGNLGVLLEVIYPNVIDVNDLPNSRAYHLPSTFDLVRDARKARLERVMAAQRLPRIRQAQNLLYTARTQTDTLSEILQYLPDPLSNVDLERQAQVALAAYKAGLSVSCTMGRGGFDTHGNHDNVHIPNLASAMTGLSYLFQRAEELGIRDELVVLVSSDFGRTPDYNSGNGKDHWSVTSAMIWGVDFQGNRVVGATDAELNYRTVNETSMAVVDDGSGVDIQHADIHKELRAYFGVAESPLLAPFHLQTPHNLRILT
ncbi:MAG: DUF1501 domain-containing protein [Polyangiaceae bacterium]|nr:DUF1501 domain-containing protein [Polyangiaceae bacterium]